MFYACGYYSDEEGENNWADVAMVAINNHLKWFRMLPWVMGGVGMLLIGKYSGMVLYMSCDCHMIRTFHSSLAIVAHPMFLPASFLEG